MFTFSCLLIRRSTLTNPKEIISEVHRLPKVDRNQIRLIKFLGSGAFGKVYMGALKPPFPVEIPETGIFSCHTKFIAHFGPMNFSIGYFPFSANFDEEFPSVERSINKENFVGCIDEIFVAVKVCFLLTLH